MLHSINKEQGLYVITEQHGGYSCLGFNVAQERIERLAAEMRQGGRGPRSGHRAESTNSTGGVWLAAVSLRTGVRRAGDCAGTLRARRLPRMR